MSNLKKSNNPFSLQKKILWSKLLSNSFDREISVPKNLFNPRPNGIVFIYALDKYTIGVTRDRVDTWKAISSRAEMQKVKIVGDKIIIPLSDGLRIYYSFYEDSVRSVISSSGRNSTLLIVVTKEER